MIKASLGKDLDGLIQRLFPFLFRRAIDPNALTLLGTGISLLAAFTFARGAFALGGCLILLGGFFDLVDGVVARHQGRASDFGAFLDSTLDRLVDMAVLVGIGVAYAALDRPDLVALAGLALISSVMVSYTKARAERFVERFEVGVFERGERFVCLALGALTGWMVPALWILAIGSLVTLGQRFALAYRMLALREEP